MLKIRIIPCLDVADGRVVKGVNFKELVDAGDPVEAAKSFNSDMNFQMISSHLRGSRSSQA